MSGADGALSADLYNRQLHPQEKTAAQQIAANAAAQGITNPDGSPITADQIENAMRAANNSQYGENRGDGCGVAVECEHTGWRGLRHNRHDAHEGQRGQQLSGAGPINARDAVADGAESHPAVDGRRQLTVQLGSPFTNAIFIGFDFGQLHTRRVYQAVNGQYRQQVTVGGGTYDIGLTGTCATAECVANGSNINWTGTGSKQLQQAINTGLVTAISNGVAIVSIGWPTGFAGAAAGYVGLSADAVSATLQNSFAPLATDIVGIPMQAYLHGLGWLTASRVELQRFISNLWVEYLAVLLRGSDVSKGNRAPILHHFLSFRKKLSFVICSAHPVLLDVG